MSLKLPFEMRNLTSFQMEKLYYILKLKVLEEMNAEDTVELVKVNVGFQSTLPRRPWLVFGHHVHRINLQQWEEIFLQKLPGLDFVKIDATHLPLAKRIHSCDKLWIDWRQEEVTDEFVTIVNQLKSVKFLNFERKTGQCFWKFLENFHGMVEESIWLPEDVDLRNQVVSKLFDNFIANQATDCEEFLMDSGTKLFHRYYNAFAKTSIKFFVIYVSLRRWEEMVQSIVKRQIPSKNWKAAVYVPVHYSQEMIARIVDFLSHFPGMKRFDRESHQEVIKMVSEVVKRKQKKFAIDMMDGLFFQRNIDASRDCVYMLQSDPQKRFTNFLAFYAQPQMEMMQF